MRYIIRKNISSIFQSIVLRDFTDLVIEKTMNCSLLFGRTLILATIISTIASCIYPILHLKEAQIEREEVYGGEDRCHWHVLLLDQPQKRADITLDILLYLRSYGKKFEESLRGLCDFLRNDQLVDEGIQAQPGENQPTGGDLSLQPQVSIEETSEIVPPPPTYESLLIVLKPLIDAEKIEEFLSLLFVKIEEAAIMDDEKLQEIKESLNVQVINSIEGDGQPQPNVDIDQNHTSLA